MQKLSRFRCWSPSRRPAVLWSLHHISSLALKYNTIIDLGYLVSGVVISISPSTPPLYICSACCDGIVCFYHCYHITSPIINCSMLDVVVKLRRSSILCLYHVSCIIKISRYQAMSSCTIAVLIAEVFVDYSLCVPMCQLDVVRLAALRVPFVAVDLPEVEGVGPLEGPLF